MTADQLLHEDPPIVPPTLLVPGVRLMRRGVYVYRCPVCSKLFRYDDPYGPICTGPSENRDDHPPELMILIRTEQRKTIA